MTHVQNVRSWTQDHVARTDRVNVARDVGKGLNMHTTACPTLIRAAHRVIPGHLTLWSLGVHAIF